MTDVTAHAPARRADARRTTTAVLGAAAVYLSRDPDASVAQIALTAAIGAPAAFTAPGSTVPETPGRRP